MSLPGTLLPSVSSAVLLISHHSLGSRRTLSVTGIRDGELMNCYGGIRKQKRQRVSNMLPCGQAPITIVYYTLVYKYHQHVNAVHGSVYQIRTGPFMGVSSALHLSSTVVVLTLPRTVEGEDYGSTPVLVGWPRLIGSNIWVQRFSFIVT